jgi:hypothetical protein
MARCRYLLSCCAMSPARLAALTGCLLAALCAPAAAHAEDLTLGAGAYTIDTSALTITGPGVDATGFADGTIAAFPFENITIPSTATVTVAGSRALSLRASDALTAGGTFEAGGADAIGGTPGGGGPGGGSGGDVGGAGAGLGPGGAATNAVSGGGGGGHTGDGSPGASAMPTFNFGTLLPLGAFGGPGGTSYVTTASPLLGGSGGGGSANSAGGGGGGAVELVGRTVIVSNPLVRANGGDGAASPHAVSGAGGGGSAGMIRIVADAFGGVFSGEISGGDGGQGGAAGGGGGAGMFHLTASSFPGDFGIQMQISGGGNGPGSLVPSPPNPGGGASVISANLPTVAERLDELEDVVNDTDGIDGRFAFEASRDETEVLCGEIDALIEVLIDADTLPPDVASLIIELRTRLACGPLEEEDGGGGDHGAELLPDKKPEQAPATQTATVLQQLVRDHTVIHELAPAPNAIAVTPTLNAAGTRAVVTKAAVKKAVKKAKAAKKRTKARRGARSGKRARARNARPRVRRAG